MNMLRRVVGFWSLLSLGAAGATAAMSSGCGTSAYVNTDGGTTSTSGGGTSGGGTPDAGEQLATAGQLCSDASTCASHLCLPLSANAQGANGLCSAACRSNADCGGQGICIPEPSRAGGPLGDAGACYRSCSTSSDCAGGIPCIWQLPFDAGVCQPLPTTFCDDIAALGKCQQCLGKHCCLAVTACAEDVECGKSETNPALASGNAAAQAVAACLADGGDDASCAGECN
jgi:hypothetical protein